ncbi:cytosolic sulfotransferase 15-like [Olea europaea subsp. europaea]|uniref:Sulfotransferase n=1 Tax=Olea europaea subsp. europaea TaxID=158383 RepID=A0A8S0RBX3_OLEEU|nr:cytosolic sulfotransferase 15-like [Olea europaea subsp. europaea]
MGNKENGERCPLSHTAVTVSLDIQVFKYRGREERRGKILRSDIGYLTEGTQERLGSIHLSQVFTLSALFGGYDVILECDYASLNSLRKVLFLRYEDLKDNIVFFIQKLAEFIGFPFLVEEEKQGLIEQLSRFCSLYTTVLYHQLLSTKHAQVY